MRRIPYALLGALMLFSLLPAAANARKSTGSCLLRAGSPQCYLWFGKVTFLADGDTLSVDIDGDRTHRSERIRITGIQAMEQSNYPVTPSKRRGDCHAVEATDRLQELLKAGRYRVRLAAQDPTSQSRKRLLRAVAVKIDHKWVDVGRVLLSEGHALWLPYHSESAWNRDYSILAERAQAAGVNLWDTDYCGPGPVDTANLRMWVNWDADGYDDLDPDGEWIRIKNLDLVNAMPLGGWYVRDSGLRRYTFPYYATVPPGGEITVYAGEGDSTDSEFYWGLKSAVFSNVTHDGTAMGDGAYLFDPQGDVRMWFDYPCRLNCSDPAQGVLQLSASPKGHEAVRITNVGTFGVDLEQYRLTSKPYGYSFGPDSVLQPGEVMRVRLGDALDDDRPLTRYWATNGPILNNGGDSVQLRTYDDRVVACTSWGSATC
jgi:endonuclease YncB( thermonuclease family)